MPQNRIPLPERRVHRFSGEARWEVRDCLNRPFFAWPKTPLTFSIDFAQDPAFAAELCLYLDGKIVPFQMSNTQTRTDGALLSADLHVLSDLPRGTVRRFRLTRGTPQSFPNAATLQGRALSNGLLTLRLPADCENPAEIPGSICALRHADSWIGESRLHCAARQLLSLRTECVAQGAVCTQLRMEYRFSGDGIYRADIFLYDGLDFAVLVEACENIPEADGLFWQLDWSGFAPAFRFAPNNPGKLDAEAVHSCADCPWQRIDEPYVQSFTHPMDLPTVGADGELPFRLNVFETQNAASRNKAASFWDAAGESIGLFVLDSEGWNNGKYDSFTAGDGSAVRYFYRDGLLSWRFPIASGTRRIGLSVYAHQKDIDCFEAVRSAVQGENAPETGLHAVSYTSYLENWHNTLNLDKVKEYILACPAADAAALPRMTSSFATAADFLAHLERYQLLSGLALYGASINGGFSGVPYRRVSELWLDAYLCFYKNFTQEEHAQTRAAFLMLLYLAQGECCTPQFILLGGPPNLLSDVKRCLGIASWLFPAHPHTPLFAATFEKMLELTTHFMTRPALPKRGLRGGRWAESPGVYTWAFLHPTLRIHALARQLGGRENRFCNPQSAALGEWLIHMLTAPFDGENPRTYEMHRANGRYWRQGCYPQGTQRRRLQLPQGAHSARRVPPNTLRLLAQTLERYAPLTAESLYSLSRAQDCEAEKSTHSAWHERLFAADAHKCGTRPPLRSCAFTGCGIILRAAVDTPRECSVHLQQIDGGPNYRWGAAAMGGSGALYYFASGKAYSHNGSEEMGDHCRSDCDSGCIFGVWKGHQYRAIGPNVLQNGAWDLGGFQLAQIEAEQSADSYAWPEYQSRAVLLSHSDYMLIRDTVGAPTVQTRFAWSAARYDAFPQIHFLTPVSAPEQLQTAECKKRWYHGKGDSLALVTHKKGLQIAREDGFIRVQNGKQWTDFLWSERSMTKGTTAEIAIHAQTAAVRLFANGSRTLTLFCGESLRHAEVALETPGAALAVSVDIRSDKPIHGRIVSRQGGRFRVSCADCGCGIWLDGEPQAADAQGFYTAAVGEHSLCLTQGGELPIPDAAKIQKIVTGDGTAQIFWQPVPNAAFYLVAQSENNGESWRSIARTTVNNCKVENLINGQKYHFRITAANAQHRAAPSHEYPAAIEKSTPLPPEGLAFERRDGGLAFSWGEVLGAKAYSLRRRVQGGEWQRLCQGEGRRYFLPNAGEIPAEYAVNAANFNGAGAYGAPITDDPSTPENWRPPKWGFDRSSLYNHHPFYAHNTHQFQPTPEQYEEEVWDE